MKLICLGFSYQSRIFHSFGDVTITDEELQILVYTQHSWPLSSEGSLVCHTYCDTGHPFVWSSLRTHNTLTCCQTIGSGAVTTCFQIYHDPESNPDLPHVRQKLYKMSHCGVYNEAISWIFSLIFIHIPVLHILFTRLYTNSFPGKEKKIKTNLIKT